MQWIACTERMPGRGWVLTYALWTNPAFCSIEKATWDGNAWDFADSEIWGKPVITHWMPIPDPPEGMPAWPDGS